MWPLIKLNNELSIPTYFIYLSVLYSFLIFYLYRRSLKKNFSVEHSMNLALIIMTLGFVGSRLLHVFFEEWSYYEENWIRVFQFWQGGFVFYGGALFATLGSLFYLKKVHQPFLPWLHFFAPIGALGYGLGRISCFLSGCCYGQLCELPWAIGGRHPTQLYAAFWELGIFLFLLFLEKKRAKNIFFVWIFFHSIGRLVMEQYRADFRGIFWFGFSLSSWISFIALGLSLGWLAKDILLKSKFRKKHDLKS